MSKNMDKDVAAIKKCVCDDKLFRAEVQKYIGRVRESKLKVGELFHYYIIEHGNTYGDGICQRISELTGLSCNTVRSYHGYYRLLTEMPDNSNLSNLCDSSVYQLSRLLVMEDDSTEPILKLAEDAYRNDRSVAEVQKAVSGILDEHERINGKKRRGGKAEARYSPAIKAKTGTRKLTIEAEDIGKLEEAVGVLELIADSRSEYGKGTGIAATKRQLTRILDLELKCLGKMIEAGEAGDIEILIKRAMNELRNLHEELERSRQKKEVA